MDVAGKIKIPNNPCHGAPYPSVIFFPQHIWYGTPFPSVLGAIFSGGPSRVVSDTIFRINSLPEKSTHHTFNRKSELMGIVSNPYYWVYDLSLYGKNGSFLFG